MADYRKLIVWQRAHRLTLSVYRATSSFPASEAYGLTSQTRRAAISVAANIAEGAGRRARRDFARFCNIASGSLNEVEYHLLVAHDLGYLDSAHHVILATAVAEVRRPLTGLAQSLLRHTDPDRFASGNR